MIEMSVDKETVTTVGNTQASSPPPLRIPHLSECTGSYNHTSKMTDVNPDSRDGAAAGPMAASLAPKEQASPAKPHDQTERMEVGAGLNNTHFSRSNGVQQPKQQHYQQQQQQKLSKPRNTTSEGFKHPQSGKRRRRANSESNSPLPTNFLLGGNIFDPLNLNSLLDEEVNRALNAETPKSSPLPAKSQDPVEILIPRDITDPLNLNSGGGGCFLATPFRRRRNRNRHHGGGAGSGDGAGGVSALRQDIADSERASEVSSSASSLAVVSSVPGPVEASRGGGALPSVTHTSRGPQPTTPSGQEGVAPPPSDPQAPEDPPAPAGGPTQHPGRPRRRRRFSGKTEPPPSLSTPTGPPWAEDRGGGAGHSAHPPHTPGSSGSRSCPGGRNPRKQQHKARFQQGNQQGNHNKARFQYGNYSKYYGYRNPGASEDPRLRALRPEWFQGKEVLDLGCNTGHLTLCIAQRLRPARILGLDIDGGLVHAARQNIRHYLSDMTAREARHVAGGEEDAGRTAPAGGEVGKGEGAGREGQNGEQAEKTESGSAQAAGQQASRLSAGGAAEEVERGDSGGAAGERPEHSGGAGDRPEHRSFPVSLRISRGPIAAPPLPDTPTTSPGDFPANVSFLKVNYVLENDALLATQRPEYDVILCMSVTKWVHLNWGDGGLKRLFHRIYRHLRPGGRFILEPQPWESYAKRKMLTDSIYRNYHSICLRPDQFSTYLTSEVGFSSYELIGTPKNSSRGFQRPIYLFHK